MRRPGGPYSLDLRLKIARLASSCFRGLRGCRRPTAWQLRTFVIGNGGILATSSIGLLSATQLCVAETSDRSCVAPSSATLGYHDIMMCICRQGQAC